jgi:hypothetical protein
VLHLEGDTRMREGGKKGGMVATWSSATVVCARPRRASTRGGGHMVEALSRGAGSARAT